MFERTFIRDLPQQIDREVKIQGWVHTLRDQKTMLFIIVRDNTGSVQVMLDKARLETDAALAGTVGALTRESTVTLTGRVVANPNVRLGGLEIQLASLTTEGLALSPLPFDPHNKTQPKSDTRFDWRFLDLRRAENLLAFQVQTTLEMAMREFWLREGFIEIHSPKLMGSASESGAELFKVEYFERTAYLAQSPQLYKQMAMAAGFDRVFEIAPVFRADPSFTTRHATEFTGVDIEMSWIDSHRDVTELGGRWLNHALQAVSDAHGAAIQETLGVTLHVPAVPFPHVTFDEALRILEGQGYTMPPDKKGDLDPQGERLVCQYIQEKFGHEFVFVIDYPASAKPFYAMRYADDPGKTKTFDLLWRGLEIASGGQREHRHDVLTQQIVEKGFSAEPLQFYIDFFKYGCPPHGGFGIGLARLLAILLDREHIREVTFVFRSPTRLEP